MCFTVRHAWNGRVDRLCSLSEVYISTSIICPWNFRGSFWAFISTNKKFFRDTCNQLELISLYTWQININQKFPVCLFKKKKNLHSYLYYFIFLIGVLAHHQSRTVESGFVEIAFLHVSMAFHKSLTKLFYYLLLFFKESFNWEMCLLQYTMLETVALNVSTRKCCPEPASRAAAFRIIWWNADSSMNCYKGKYAHKTNLNFYGNELQISWAEFVLRLGRFACSDNGLFCFSETCGKPGMHGWVVIPPLGESFPCCFHSL